MLRSNKILILTTLLLILAIVPIVLFASLNNPNRQNCQVARSSLEKSWKFIFLQNKRYLPTVTNDTITVFFEYLNSTCKPQLINKVLTNCGCTQVDFPQKPIRIGEEGKVKVVIDVGPNKGHFAKSVVVYFQGQKSVILRISGNRI